LRLIDVLGAGGEQDPSVKKNCAITARK